MFQGFSPETVDFLWGIRMNNNRDWFIENKKNYITNLYEPMKALGADLYKLLENKPGNLLKVSRIYRDARLHHPLPYKESLWICIRQDVEWWAENPCLYFEICPDGVDYGFVLWQPRVATMAALRQHWETHGDEFLSLISRTEAQTGVPVTANLYKRPKAAPTETLSPFYAWKNNILCVTHEDFSEKTFSPELGLRVYSFLEKLMPLYDYFNQFNTKAR